MIAAKIFLGVGVAFLCACPVMAGARGHHPHHRGGNDGVRLAANIIGLVGAALKTAEPAPIVITPPPPPPRYLVPPARPHHHKIHHRPNHRGRR
ncbi:MAG: hypothetical protein IKA87_04480 [Lentisphaeria bacterium]|nr:hypothetical protein [Lentisphaeria bacterium]